MKSFVTDLEPWKSLDQPELREQGKKLRKVEAKSKITSSESTDFVTKSDFET